VDKEQLAQALDAIHHTASQCDTLTVFNEFASPPPPSSGTEKGLTGELVNTGLSGLYTRFKEVVGGAKEKLTVSQGRDEHGGETGAAAKSSKPIIPSLKASSSSPLSDSAGTSHLPVLASAPSSRIHSPTSASFTATSEAQSRSQKSSKAPSLSTAATSKSSLSSRPIPPLTKATISSTVAPVNVSAFQDRKRSHEVSEVPRVGTVVHSHVSSSSESFGSRGHHQSADTTNRFIDVSEGSDLDDDGDAGASGEWRDSDRRARILARDRTDLSNIDGALEIKSTTSVKPSTQSRTGPNTQLGDTVPAEHNSSASHLNNQQAKQPPAVGRTTHSHLPGYLSSRASSTDRSTVELSQSSTLGPIKSHRGSDSRNDLQNKDLNLKRTRGDSMADGEPEAVYTRLEEMRKQVLSKEFWMADEICKECFLCGDVFTAFRRKHHCRTCGCIFDAKCTSMISGERFGVQGTLRVCKTCLDIIHRRHDSSGSDESADEAVHLTSFFRPKEHESAARPSSATGLESYDSGAEDEDPGISSTRPLETPMMAIPATRRVDESTNRRSAVLEIDVRELSRPSSSRSLKSLAIARPPSSGHRRQQPKQNFLGRFLLTNEDRAPFHRQAGDDLEKHAKLPTFHDDNIIDPDLAPYMSDDGSSGDEQMSIFAAMNSSGFSGASLDNERSGFGSLLSNSKKHRSRTGDKSLSGIGFTSRGLEDTSASGSHYRPGRRRNMSTASGSIYHGKGSPRLGRNGVHGNAAEAGVAFNDNNLSSPVAHLGSSKVIRSASMRDARAPALELNNASLHHVRRLLRQLLQDASIPNVSSWEKALIPILLRCTDDVNPDIRGGDDMDIRHYVKLKKIPGGKPGDTSYVSGVVFTKNLALKSMPRSVANPRIVILSFPIEYQRRQHHFMSLEPVIAQEKEFLRNMVNRIAALRPHVLLIQSHISGLALQYLAEANIAVAYNVKKSVVEAVSRCAQTDIISSIDMLALKPVQVGRSASFDVKTYVHPDIPERKKTYIYISGCPEDLGCTIVLRGASMPVLTKMKRITEFMVYVVYNLKLETCLMRDEFVLIPSLSGSGNVSPLKAQGLQGTLLGGPGTGTSQEASKVPPDSAHDLAGAVSRIIEANHASATTARPSSFSVEPHAPENGVLLCSNGSDTLRKLVSAHESHVQDAHEEPLPEDIPMPTFYSDMVAKHQTKILSASPFVKFMQPYLLMRARELERRLIYLKRLRDQDTYEERSDQENAKPQKFQLITPEMVHGTVKGAPKQVMEVLHAVHDAEYDKALHNYQTQKRQWENYIQGNINLFDPYAHQNIVVLYTVVCTATTVPCAGPELLALGFYNEHGSSPEFDPDCTLGQYVEDLCLGADTICTSNGCEKRMSEHHRTYVHGEARITVFVERYPSKIKGLHDSILMWSFCKVCQKETQVMPMSENTWKYSFGKYLELSFWSSGLRLRADVCPHDLHRDHLRYFGFRNVAVRVHHDPIDLLEIVVPRTRITWKVDNDLRLKNELYTKIEERWNRFMSSVKSRIKGINVESVVPEKVEACQVEVEKLTKRAAEEHISLLRNLQQRYMESKYYEVIPLNRSIREMQEKVAEWDAAFADFDANYFPSEKDIRRLAALQLKKMFMDRDESTTSLTPSEAQDVPSEGHEKEQISSIQLTPRPSDVSASDAETVMQSVVTEDSGSSLAEVKGLGASKDHDAHEEHRVGSSATDLAPGHDPVNPVTAAGEAPAWVDYPIEDHNLSGSSLLDPVVSGPADVPLPVDVPHAAQSHATKSLSVEESGKPNEAGLISTPGSSVDQDASDATDTKQQAERVTQRRTEITPSAAHQKALSQATTTAHRSHSTIQKPVIIQADPKQHRGDINDDVIESRTATPVEVTKEKKLSERLGLTTLRGNRKGHSLIPRSIHSKKNDSKVSTLAKHFEQLSREFEKERMRDRKQRAARVTQSRAFPRALSKPIVEVYKDVDEAVEEPSVADYDIHGTQYLPKGSTTASAVEGDKQPALDDDTVIGSSEAFPPKQETSAEMEDNQQTISQTASDDEGNGSDIDHSPPDDIPGVIDIGEVLGANESSSDIDIPKHEKTSLMKMLTNFWAERSASGWTQLEYPLSATDHVFVDSDVIVREDEPSSLIAFALSSEDYISKLETIRRKGRLSGDKEKSGPGRASPADMGGANEAEVETSLLRATGTHLKYQFAEGSAKMLCKIFYAEQFDAVRRKCGAGDRIVESLSRCLKWDSKGGKTKSVFLKTLDDRFVLKSLSPVETQAFLRFAPAYFNIMAEALFHELPTVIAKMLGFYQIIIKNPATGTEIKWDVLVMENLFYERSNMRIFDLKGSMRNRKIQSTGEENEVLLDENMVEFIYESPLFAREHSKKLLRASVWNDTLFLARQNVMDYSLMVAVDEARKELVVGIIDCIRTYTWDKKLESWIKDRGFAGGGRNRPTVTSPKEYKSRFREAMARYILQAPK
jgi:1-phosphatidylinositol-3-phosphate 5-kinase